MTSPLRTLARVAMRLCAGVLALGYLLAPAALIYAASPPPTCRITVTPTSISVGGSVTVKWTSTNATAGAITNIGNVGPTGSINLLPSSAAVTTYFGAFTGPGGTTNCQASVTVSSSGSGSGSGGSITNADGSINTAVTNTPTALGVTTPTSQSGSSGLVPCGYGQYTGNGADRTASTGCQACDLATLIQNIMTFAIGIAIPIAAALFAYAGFLYITNATNPSNKTKAKEIFKNALIGFLIAITAWLIINTLLHVIFSQGTFSSGNWFTIQCDTGNRPVNGTITGVLSSLPIVAGNLGAISNTDGGLSTNGIPSGSMAADPATQNVANSVSDALQDACANGDQASCIANLNDIPPNGRLTTSQQDTLGDNCDGGDQASCNALDAALNLASNQTPVNSSGTVSANSIASAALAYRGTDTSAGPDGGNKACAWAVNNILQSDGIAPIDGDAVSGMEAVLQNGRGTLVSTSDAQPGDIIIWKEGSVSHVGICEAAACTQAVSNSSSNAAFTNVSGPTLLGVPGRVYHVNN